MLHFLLLRKIGLNPSCYYGYLFLGECRNIPTCEPEELIDFPRRMKEWLFNIMEELQERSELSEFYSKLQKQSQISDLNQKWENAAIWKWCDLDGYPHDNVVSRHELFPVRAPLVTLEHCIGDFLDKCDSNDDHDISFNVSRARGHKVMVSFFESTTK